MALRLFRLAAEQGEVGAQFSLGAMYDEGSGISKNYREAVRLYGLAADQGQANAQNALGGMYFKGQGVLRDNAEAARAQAQ